MRAVALGVLEGNAHKGCPYGWTRARAPGGRAPTRGAPTGCWQPEEVLLVDALPGGRGAHKGCPTGGFFGARAPRGEGTHKGCPYGWVFWGAHAKGGGCAQGVSVRDAGSLRRFCP